MSISPGTPDKVAQPSFIMSIPPGTPDKIAQPSPNLQLGKFLWRVYTSRAEILEYRLDTKSLSVWRW